MQTYANFLRPAPCRQGFFMQTAYVPTSKPHAKLKEPLSKVILFYATPLSKFAQRRYGSAAY